MPSAPIIPCLPELLEQVEPRTTQEVILTLEQCLSSLGNEPGHCKLNMKELAQQGKMW